MNKTIVTLSVLLFFFSTATDEPSLKTLYDQHRWFQLRDALKGRETPPLYKGAVASAFNDPQAAEKYFSETIKLNPASGEAADARDMLIDLYGRSGQYHEALHKLDESLRMKPGRPDLVNARLLFAAWSRHPDQSTASDRPSHFQGQAARDGIVLPVSIHGKTAHWTLDTGANFSMISENEAAMLGVAVDEASASVTDAAGGAARVRTAVVDELAIGDSILRNVAFLVLPDSQQPMSDMKPGSRGLIGIQVLVALRSLAWKADGSFESGFRSAGRASGDANLCFDGLTPVTRVQFQGKQLDFVLDSGEDAGSQFWPRFADDFSTLLKERGTKSKKRVTETGGSNEREITELPEVRFQVGGFDVTLRPASVFSKPVGDNFHYGHLGLDVLAQPREVRIDLASMILQLAP